MTRTARPWLAALAAAVGVGCASSADTAEPVAEPVSEPRSARIDEEREYHVRLPMERVEDVMVAKLAHAKALLEGIALEDFEQIEANALALSRLSEEAGWRVHTTPAYGVHSDAFRVITDSIVTHARGENLFGVLEDYVLMTRACVACHGYMRNEGLYREVPGKVSSAVPSLLRDEEDPRE
ncbi:MAG: hypothetical protein ACYTGP_08060 [Planctomycetota bacterium]